MVNRIIPVEYPIDPMSFWYAVPSGKLFWKGEFDKYFNMMDFDGLNTIAYRLGYKRADAKSIEDIKYLIYDFYRSRKQNQEVERYKEELNQMDEHGLISEDMIEQQLKIKTAFGDVCIQPHEYTIPKDMSEYFENAKDGHSFIRYLSTSKALKGKFADQIFYLRTRGIPHKEAIALCFQNVNTQNLFYLELHPEYQKAFTRNYDSYLGRKIKYCIEKQRTDLLNYGPGYDYSEQQLTEVYE